VRRRSETILWSSLSRLLIIGRLKACPTSHILRVVLIAALVGAILLLSSGTACAAENPSGGPARDSGGLALPFKVSVGVEEASNPQEVTKTLQLLLFFTVLSLLPALLLTMTSFTRIVIVLSFTRRALSLQQLPPNQLLIGLSLFMTMFIMAPTLKQMNETALKPYREEKITQQQAIDNAIGCLRQFMFKQVRERDLALFVKMAQVDQPTKADDVPTYVLVPAFVISELKTAFQMGFVIYLPFLVIDMVVSSILTAMGMFMLPPVIISVPFKILLFVLVDGWHLLMRSLSQSFM